MTKTLIELMDVSLQTAAKTLVDSVNIQIDSGDVWQIRGSAGSGKTLLAKLISGLIEPSKGIRKTSLRQDELAFVSAQPWAQTNENRLSYFERRYESFFGEKKVTLLEKIQKEKAEVENEIMHHLSIFGLNHLLEKEVMNLSNGETKIWQLVCAICKKPKLLVLDEPLMGVDSSNRAIILKVLSAAKDNGTSLILVGNQNLSFNWPVKEIHLVEGKISLANREKHNYTRNISWPSFINENKSDYHIIAKLNEVSVRYEETVILDKVSWLILQGERWILKGHNGSGKSMLISLITADNPKAYGQDIVLFDRRRGSGESVREIKAKIGYLSPEMHAHFIKNKVHVSSLLGGKEKTLEDRFSSKLTCLEVVASGLYDQIGYPPATINGRAKELLQTFQMEKLSNERFESQAMSTQRLLLLMRAIVKVPPLLVLDEPCQGLDDQQVAFFKSVIDKLCIDSNMSIIYVSHSEDDVPSSIRKTIVLERGKVKEYSNK